MVAVATRTTDNKATVTAADEDGLMLEGFLTFADRPKADAGAAIAQLERLGVTVKIITGDNGLVAAKVCADIGFACAGVLSGADMESLDDDQLERPSPPRQCSPGSARTRSHGSSRLPAVPGRTWRSSGTA